jgi:hypothetical protein
MNRGAPIGFKKFGIMVWNLSIIEPCFHWFLKKNQDWQLCWNMGAFLLLLESPRQVWFNNVDSIILGPKMWTILWNISGYGC